jgi:hypothetical protein
LEYRFERVLPVSNPAAFAEDAEVAEFTRVTELTKYRRDSLRKLSVLCGSGGNLCYSAFFAAFCSLSLPIKKEHQLMSTLFYPKLLIAN